jgi:hypothetical protein
MQISINEKGGHMKGLLFGAAILGSFGFAAAQNPAMRQGTAPTVMGCPVIVENTGVATADTANGIALVFTTEKGDVAELQRRVERMANRHNAMSDRPMRRRRMVPTTAGYEAIPNGGRLIFTPKDPAQLDQLRTQVREMAERMKKGDCSMMQGMMRRHMGGTQ